MFFPVEKLDKQLQAIKLAIYRETHQLSKWKYWEGDCSHAHRPDFNDCDWAEFTLGDAWGGYDVIAWFRASISIPPHLHAKKLALYARVGPKDSGNSNAEALLYVNGTPLQALDAYHHEAWLPPEAFGSDMLHLALRAWSGVLDVPAHRHFRSADLVWIDEPTERLYYLAHTLLQAVAQLDETDSRRTALLRLVDTAMRKVQFVRTDPERLYASIAEAEQWLQTHVQQLSRDDQFAPTVIGVGHAHIDLAWLWRLAHARDKAVRTFTTALHLMRQYPDYCFLQASPQLYAFIARDQPELYAQIKAMVRAGRWEATGGMWVEADCNLPGGEALVRQILLGQRFFKAEFGVESRVLWLPDVFGYPWSLPQLMRKSGLDYFMTTKLSWNQFNRIPYDTFTWRGIDGTEVLAHFVTTPELGARHFTYNGTLTPFDVKGVWDRYQQQAINNELLLIYGWGDGGGGPTKDMLESAQVLRRLPGFPRVELGQAEPYFERLEQRIAEHDVPVWDGELYLEFHRGTYTSQAYNKRANRKAEVLYHAAEWLSALADILLQQQTYPARMLREGWELLLLNQFHDVLPGSSIRQVYEDSRAQYAEIERIGQAALIEARGALLAQIGTEQESVVVFNPLAWARHGLIEFSYEKPVFGTAVIQPDGRITPLQVTARDGRRALLYVEDVPALGYQAYPLVLDESALPAEPMIVQPDCLENRFYRIELNRNGQIRSLFDKRHQREVLAAPGNVFQVFQDIPMAFDAWDIDIFYQEQVYPVDDLIEAVVEEQGPLRGVLRLCWRFQGSRLTQWITLYAHAPRIDFRTEIDWHEQQMLLKVAFPVTIRTTRATYDIQWGNIERPTHWNTSWDWARFETIGHKWVDLSEGNYGVALLNDCKYGHDVKDNLMRLTLIKSPVRPDPVADQGTHIFTYSLLPHSGEWRAGDVARHGYDLNNPFHAAHLEPQPTGTLPASYTFAEVATDHVILETVKQAEDDAAYIVRVYEYKQYRNNAVTIQFGQPILRAVECNLLEQGAGAVSVDGRRLTFAIGPYEIKTFKVWFGQPA